MSGRRDSKNRKLNKGEYQRADGRYAYRYVDSAGDERWIYSWKLTATDRVPEGKTCGPCLRDMEVEIQRDLADGINVFKSKQKTLNDCFESYMKVHSKLKERTKLNYRRMWRCHVERAIGRKYVGDILHSDVLYFLTSLIEDKGLAIGTVEAIQILVHAVLKLAVRDNLVRTNQSEGAMKEIVGSDCTEKKKHALTIAEQQTFIKFLEDRPKYRRWYRLFIFLLGTGCRIGEASGLRWSDCDFENGLISINQQVGLYRKEGDTRYKYHVDSPKTESGIRVIPMLDAVRQVLIEERTSQNEIQVKNKALKEYDGFVFRTKTGHCLDNGSVTSALKRIIQNYNLIEEEFSRREGRAPFFLPNFTTHDLRHTFCTRLCENETNLKTIQDVMGHSNIETTMNIYNEATLDTKITSFRNLEGKIV